MADFTSENIFDAVSILIDKKLETIKFDETINAEIVDDTNKSRGEYTVSIENTQFKAFSSNTDYKNGDTVMVTVPQGDYDNQKIIIGKYVKDNNTPMSYKSPFSYFINLTGNLLLKEKNNISEDDSTTNGDEFVKKTANLTANSDESSVQIANLKNLNYQNYTQLGIEAQFCSWLGEYDTVEGHYGLTAILTLQSLADSTKTTTVALDFNSDNFIGNVYDFQTYYVQQGVFDISEYAKDYKITQIEIDFYQGNDFKDIDGAEIPGGSDDNNIFESTIGPNLFVKDVLVALGSSSENFTKDEVILYSDNGLTYAKNYELKHRKEYNQKLAIARWIHQDTETDTIQALSFDDAVPQNYEIRWYHKRIGAPSPDAFAGAHWERYYGQSENADDNGDWLRPEQPEWLLVKSIEDNQTYYRYNEENNQYVIVNISEILQKDGEDHFIYNDEYQGFKKQDTEEYISLYLVNDFATNKYQVEFQPNVNNQTEELKVIIIKDDRLVVTSNILTFTNDDEVRNKATLIDANALSIQYEDAEKGHYFLYDESGEIGKNEDTEVRILTAVFDEQELDVYKKSELKIEECSKVVWTFPGPSSNTMIVPMTEASENASVLKELDENGLYTRTDCVSVGFTIKKQLNNNATQNRIRLDITKDGQDYSAWVDPIFGTSGDNGSDYKVVLTWRDDKNALNLSKDNNGFLEPYNNNLNQTALVGDVVIFDQAGDVINWPNGATLEANWLVAEFGTTSKKEKEKEEQDIYYPVFSNDNKTLNYNLPYSHPDAPYQSNGYYYFVDTLNSNSQLTKYVKFDLKNKSFTSQNLSITDQLYRKRTSDEEKKNKLEFRKVEFTTPPLNKETGEYNEGHGDVDPIQVVEGEKKYYYSKNKKYFIKINEQYVLDPWEDYEEVETYYEPIEAKEKVYTLNSVGNTTGGLNAVTNGQVVTITADASVDMNSLFILQLTLKDFGDYDLVSYYPIALKNGETRQNLAQEGEDPLWQSTRIIQYIEGPDRVRYGSSGETDFKKNPYQINTLEFKSNKFESHYHGYQNDNLQGYWQLLFPVNSEKSNFDPILKESKDINIDDNYIQFSKPLLSPSSVYIPGVRPYGVQFLEPDTYELIASSDEYNEINEVYIYNSSYELQNPKLEGWSENTYYKRVLHPLWTQPILVYQNKYPSRTLNKWNGKDIETDKDAGTITASGFAAGRKERNNTFTGVVIGDWSRSKADSAITKNTGLYGFNHGAMSYAFKDDGTGFIGKDGKGRIYLDGDKSQIFSSNWANHSEPQGMLLDIDDGFIKMQSIDKTTDVYTKVTKNVKDKYFSWVNGYIIKSNLTQADNPFAEESSGSPLKLYDNQGEITQSRILNIGDRIYFTSPIDIAKSRILSDDRENDGYVLKWFNPNNQNTLNPIYRGRLYKDPQGNNEVSINGIYNSGTTYYLKESGTRYITIGADQPTTPLSIGTEKNVSQRRFRVDWDGKLHVIDGDFSGDISGSNISGGTISGGYITGSSVYATYLDAQVGNIGGWTIDQVSLQSTDQKTILRANPSGDLSNIETDTIAIKATGQHDLDAKTLTGKIGYIEGKDGNNETTDAMGFITEGRALILGVETKNISGTSTVLSGNIGIRTSEDIYISAGTPVNTNTTTSGSGEIILYNNPKDPNAKNDAQGKGGVKIEGNYLEVTSPAEHQTGIYARFAE